MLLWLRFCECGRLTTYREDDEPWRNRYIICSKCGEKPDVEENTRRFLRYGQKETVFTIPPQDYSVGSNRSVLYQGTGGGRRVIRKVGGLA